VNIVGNSLSRKPKESFEEAFQRYNQAAQPTQAAELSIPSKKQSYDALLRTIVAFNSNLTNNPEAAKAMLPEIRKNTQILYRIIKQEMDLLDALARKLITALPLKEARLNLDDLKNLVNECDSFDPEADDSLKIAKVQQALPMLEKLLRDLNQQKTVVMALSMIQIKKVRTYLIPMIPMAIQLMASPKSFALVNFLAKSVLLVRKDDLKTEEQEDFENDIDENLEELSSLSLDNDGLIDRIYIMRLKFRATYFPNAFGDKLQKWLDKKISNMESLKDSNIEDFIRSIERQLNDFEIERALRPDLNMDFVEDFLSKLMFRHVCASILHKKLFKLTVAETLAENLAKEDQQPAAAPEQVVATTPSVETWLPSAVTPTPNNTPSGPPILTAFSKDAESKITDFGLPAKQDTSLLENKTSNPRLEVTSA
jgi:hypothetical protein